MDKKYLSVMGIIVFIIIVITLLLNVSDEEEQDISHSSIYDKKETHLTTAAIAVPEESSEKGFFSGLVSKIVDFFKEIFGGEEIKVRKEPIPTKKSIQTGEVLPEE